MDEALPTIGGASLRTARVSAHGISDRASDNAGRKRCRDEHLKQLEDARSKRRTLKRPSAVVPVAKRPAAADVSDTPASAKRIKVGFVPTSLAEDLVSNGGRNRWLLEAAHQMMWAAARKHDDRRQSSGLGPTRCDKLNDHYLHQDSNSRIATKVSITRVADLTKSNQQYNYVCRTANLIVHEHRLQRSSIEKLVTHHLKQCRLREYFDISKQDEASMPVGRRIGDHESGAYVANGPITSDGVIVLHSIALAARAQQSQTRVVSKILQSDAGWAMVVEIGADVVELAGECATWLQLLDRNSASNLLQAENNRTSIVASVRLFVNKTRVSTLDRHPANELMETELLLSRPGWERLASPCETHNIAVGMKWSYRLAEDVIDGQIKYALSINFGTNLNRLQQKIIDFCVENVQLTSDVPSESAQRFKRHMITLTLSRSTKSIQKAALLRYLPNGDWRVHTGIPICVPPGALANRAQIGRIVGGAIVQCAAATLIPKWPKHRWRRHQQAISPMLLIEAINGTGSGSYKRLANDNRLRPECKRQRTVAPRAGRGPGAGGIAVIPAVADAVAHAGHEAQGGALGADNVAQDPELLEERRREENHRFINDTGDYFASKPLARMTVTCQVAEMFEKYMEQVFHLGTPAL